MDSYGQRDSQIEEVDLIEQDRAYYRYVLEEGRHEFQREDFLEMVAYRNIAAEFVSHHLADELGDSCSEGGHRKTGDVLVGPEGDGYEAEDKSGSGSCGESAQNCNKYCNKSAGGLRTYQGLVSVCSHESQDASHVHDALDSEVEVSGFLGDYLSHGSEHENGGVGSGCRDKCYQCVHAFTSLSVFFRKIIR